MSVAFCKFFRSTNEKTIWIYSTSLQSNAESPVWVKHSTCVQDAAFRLTFSVCVVQPPRPHGLCANRPLWQHVGSRTAGQTLYISANTQRGSHSLLDISVCNSWASVVRREPHKEQFFHGVASNPSAASVSLSNKWNWNMLVLAAAESGWCGPLVPTLWRTNLFTGTDHHFGKY